MLDTCGVHFPHKGKPWGDLTFCDSGWRITLFRINASGFDYRYDFTNILRHFTKDSDSISKGLQLLVTLSCDEGMCSWNRVVWVDNRIVNRTITHGFLWINSPEEISRLPRSLLPVPKWTFVWLGVKHRCWVLVAQVFEKPDVCIPFPRTCVSQCAVCYCTSCVGMCFLELITFWLSP